MSSPSRKGFIEAQGAALEYATWGADAEADRAIVLLHEGLGCVALWRDFPQRLLDATGLPVIAFSRQGYGQSDPVELPRPLDYMTREACDVLPAVLRKLGLSRYILVGHSDGATIAAIYAGRVPDAGLEGLVLMAPHFFAEDISLAAIASARDAYDSGALRERLALYHSDPDGAFRGWNGAWLDPKFEHWNVTNVLPGIGVPILAIQGRDDQYGTRAQIDCIAARSAAPVDTVVLEDCRHIPFVDQPAATLSAITGFSIQLLKKQ